MKLRKIGISLCLTAMAGVIFNMGAAACTKSDASEKGTAGQQQFQSSYGQEWQQIRFPYAAGTAQKQQPKNAAFWTPFQKQQPKSSAFKVPAQKQEPKNSSSKASSQKQEPKAPSAEELAQVQAQREQINTLNAKVLSLKNQARKDIGIICADLARVAFDPDVRESQDYKTIVDTLNKVKTELADAEKIDYRTKLVSVQGKTDASTLSSVIKQLNAKISDLTAVVDELNDLLPKADALVKQELENPTSSEPTSSQPTSSSSEPTSSQPTSSQPANQAWQQFVTQANAKKKTIDSNTQKITAANKSCQDVVNEIVATAAANKDVLEDQSGMVDIVIELGSVKTSLMAESNGKIAEALKVYDQDLKKKDYAGALDQLDAIIGIQNNRISVVQSALSQLQSTLSSLQNLVATAAASSASSTASSQAA